MILVEFTKQFLGYTRFVIYEVLISNLLKDFKTPECNMWFKVHFLYFHLDYYPTNLGVVSDEHDKRIHSDIMNIVKKYQGEPTSDMLADLSWTTVHVNA